MTRVRTIDAALEQLQQDDPGCCLTRHALRRMVLMGKVPHVTVGNKYLLNYDALLKVLMGETSTPPESIEEEAIRRLGFDENGRRSNRAI